MGYIVGTLLALLFIAGGCVYGLAWMASRDSGKPVISVLLEWWGLTHRNIQK